jgi:hypothetical protein
LPEIAIGEPDSVMRNSRFLEPEMEYAIAQGNRAMHHAMHQFDSKIFCYDNVVCVIDVFNVNPVHVMFFVLPDVIEVENEAEEGSCQD